MRLVYSLRCSAPVILTQLHTFDIEPSASMLVFMRAVTAQSEEVQLVYLACVMAMSNTLET